MEHTDTLSPSGSARWMLCPGSVRESKKYPDTTNDASIDGTHSHTLLEYCQNNNVDPNGLIGLKLKDHDGEFEIHADRVERVKVALEYVSQRLSDDPVSKLEVETRVNPGAYFDRDDFWGTADVQIISEKVYEVIDYKDGYTPVPVDTPQLKIYALGGVHKYFGTDGKLLFDVIRLTIIQPKSSEPIKFMEMTPDELMTWANEELDPAIKATNDPNAPLIAGDVQCKWCKARGNCATQAEAALKGAQIMFEQVNTLTEQSAEQDSQILSNEQLLEIMEAKPLIETFLKDVEKEVMRRFEIGQDVPGLKMVYSGRGQRAWDTDKDVEKLLWKTFKIPKAMLYEETIISPAKVKKIKWEDRKGNHHTLTTRQLQKVDEYVTKGKGSKMVVPESDSRESINKSADVLFADVTTIPDWLS